MHTFEEWGDHVFAHFDTGVTGAFVESANAVARCFNRMGRGYSLPVLRARLLYGMKGTCVDSSSKGVPISTLHMLCERKNVQKMFRRCSVMSFPHDPLCGYTGS
jgi:hypothetical protein